ncbi:GDP-4-dehydro-6-deoxy-D-mannose reductase [Bosea sp. OAE506]|uniref:GDP-mannose 4,6-dehydratase n=1 Tax=Bosea sp. OAE506 TaxID=2663870 RepID=UPI001789A825
MVRAAPRILVTGAGGFVGSVLLQRLSARLPADACIHAAGHAGDDGRIIALDLDVTDYGAVERAVISARPDAVMHLAAVSAFQMARNDPLRAWQVNLTGTLNLATAIMTHAPEALLVFAGTSEAYGDTFNRSTQPIDESAALLPRSLYAATKAAADIALGQMAHDGLNVVRFRPFNHTGPGQIESFVVPAFAAQIARIEAGLAAPVIEVGNLDAQRDFLDVRDVVSAYEAVLLDKPVSTGAVFNLSSGQPRRIGDILNQLLAMSTVGIEVRIDPARLRPNEVPVVAGDSSHARSILGWQPRLPWETTLEGVLEGFRRSSGTQRPS